MNNQTWKRRYEGPPLSERNKKRLKNIGRFIHGVYGEVTRWISYNKETIAVSAAVIIFLTLMTLVIIFGVVVQPQEQNQTIEVIKMEDIRIPVYFNETDNGTLSMDEDTMREEFEDKLEKARIEIEGS